MILRPESPRALKRRKILTRRTTEHEGATRALSDSMPLGWRGATSVVLRDLRVKTFLSGGTDKGGLAGETLMAGFGS